MLDTLKQRVKEEIAIDGDTEVASQSNVSITPLVDERYKQFFWKYLAAESDLTFYESANEVEEDEEEILAIKKRKRPLPKKKKKPVAKKPKKKKAAKKKKVAVGDSDDDFVDDDVSESSSESEFDELVSSEEEEPQEEEEERIKRPNSNSSAELQEEQLYVNVPPGNLLSPNLLAVLKEIIKTRKEGLYQANITKLLQLDSRSTGHYVKSLEEKGAITRSGVSINSMYTNICIHARFNGEKTKLDMNTVGNDKKSNQIPYNVNAYGKVYSQRMVLDAFVEFAQGAPNKIIVARDVLHALGFDSTRRQVQKWYNRVIDEICMKGYFKKHNIQVEEKGHRFRGLELLNEPIDKSTTNVTTSVDTVELPIRIESNQKDIPVIHLLWDLSVEAQCLQVISAAGTNGVTQKDISFALNIDEQRVMNKALEHLVDPKSHVNDRYRVVRFLEFDRRLKRYRYYTKAAHLKMTENIDLPPQPMPSPGIDISKCFERNIFYDAPHDTTNFNKFIDLYVKARTNKNTVLNALHASTSYNGFAGKPVPMSKTRLAKTLTTKKTNRREGTRSQTLHITSVDQPADQAPSSAPKKPSVPVEKTLSPVPAAQESETTSVSPSILPLEKETDQLSEETTKDNVESTEQASAEPMDICEPSSTEALSNNPVDQATHLAPSDEQAESSTCEISTVEEPHDETSHNDPLQSLAVDNFDYDKFCTYDDTAPQGKQARILVNGVWVYHHKPKHRRNPYAAARMKAMVTIVWKRRITEFDRDFRNEYLKILETLNTVHKGTVCNKTIWKTALDAQEEGLVKTSVITISLLSGATIDRKIIVRGDIDLEGEEYQKFVSLMKDRKVLSTSQYGFSSTGVTNIPVERLDARLARMQEEANNQQDVAKAKLMEERVSELYKNLNLFSQKKQAAAPFAWMISALQFGWIQAIMVRARILYEQIIRLLDTDTEGVFPEERLMNATTIIKSMSVGTVCQIIGLHQPSKRLASFVKDPDNADLVFDQLPAEIRAELFGEPNKFRRRLRVIFQVLQYIEVITPVFPGESEGQSRPAYVEYAPQYRIEPVVEIRDRRIVGEPVRYVKHVNNLEDARSLFSDLQYVYVNPSAHPSPESSVAPLPEDPVLLQLFKTTHNRNNWSTTSVFSAEKRKHINTYIDKKNFTTPLDNITLMRQISREADCPIYALRLYYQKAQAILNQKKLKNELQYVMSRSPNSGKRVRRGKRVDPFEGRRVIKKDSAHAFVSRKYERHLIVLPHVDMETGELLFMDDMKDLPVLPSNDDASHLRKPRGKRFIWTRRDDELLMYANIVLRQRTGRQRFSWVPIVKQFFPETPFSSCRHRYTKLMRMAEWKEMFETHTYLWHKIYDEGLAKGEIEDKDPEDNINCDLLGLVTYFIQKLSENTPENLPSQPLPKTIQDFHANLEIANRPNKSFSQLHDAFHESHTMARKTQVLYSQAFILHRYDAKRLDQSEAAIESDLDKTSRDAKLCRSFALMSLMTPSEYYDPFYCYSVLQQFPKSILDDTLKKMRDDGTLVLTIQNRPIPGTRFSLSEKFMRCMAGQLPNNIFQQANEYEKFLRQQNGMIRFTSDYASSGMIACLLNLVSDNKLSMAPVNLNRILKAMSKENFHIRSIDARLVRFDINVEILEKEDQMIPYMPSAEQPPIKQLGPSAFKMELKKLLESQDDWFGELLKQIVDLLYKEAENGLTLYQLKSKVDSIYTDENVMHAIHVLYTNQPILICRVGFEAVRYVHISFAKNWTISTNVSRYDVSNVKIRGAIEEASKKVDMCERKELIVPSIWTDANGSTTDVILRDCKDFLVDLILNKPGITEADIHRQAEMALSKRELRDVLNMLVEQQVLRQVCLSFPSKAVKKASVFNRLRTISCKNNNSIENLTQSCFWVTSKPY
ncbi:hypothetical protein EDC96DRAFT_601189, partial [Choanephora cucurbitarum]